MTPDRPDHTDDDAAHGVLSDSGSIETSGLGILGGATEGFSVSLPAASDDDLTDDDDVIGDEMPLQIDTDLATETAEGEIIDVSPLAYDESDGRGDAVAGHDVEDAEVIDDPAAKNIDGGSAAPSPSADAASGYDALIAGAVAAAVAEPETVTGSTPATRREAYHPDSLDRVQSVERVTPHTEVTLTSKRLGEFDGNRESADLLTADRLLDPHQVVRPEPEGAWQHFVYSISGHRINLGDGKRARASKELDRRIAAPLTGGARFVPVLSRKGGVGKTTVTTLLGMALADARDDRVIAVDANPDRGTLAERIARSSGKTVRDLVRARGEVVGYNDLSSIVARDETRLDVLASDADPRVSEAFSDRDYLDVASLAAHYYSIVLTDTGTGIVHSVMGATLDLADQLVVVSGLSVDEARLASETLTWLETNGYAEQVRSAVVVLNSARPGTPLVRPQELEGHFRTRVRNVVRIPYDPHIAAGSAIAFRDLQPATRLAARELAASVVEGLRSLARAA
ncbi:MinD/ParA family protein [Microbacterium pumilum]|uniref:CobQ/CobB/MinD/ParA nucleotide binding domain-containing protein n=1 Tax=Microbacterium pumilum TaxID=344165 RepID=A0ABP5DWK2_9MICO